jgi:hypothetical protein
VTLASAIAMWYVPYFFGANEEKKREYSRMYAGTRDVLPARGDNPRPNLLHICFHALFVINFLLVLDHALSSPLHEVPPWRGHSCLPRRDSSRRSVREATPSPCPAHVQLDTTPPTMKKCIAKCAQLPR